MDPGAIRIANTLQRPAPKPAPAPASASTSGRGHGRDRGRGRGRDLALSHRNGESISHALPPSIALSALPPIHPPNPSIRPSGHPSNQFIHDARAQEPVTRDTARVSTELAAAPVFHRLSAVSDASVQPAPQQQHLHQSRTLAVYHHQHPISVQHSS